MVLLRTPFLIAEQISIINAVPRNTATKPKKHRKDRLVSAAVIGLGKKNKDE
jgi:hypothetical protein